MHNEQDEIWAPVPGFPIYSVSNFGRVLNVDTDIIKLPHLNQHRHASVLLIDPDGRQCRKSIALLVANEFIPQPIRADFNTPIHLDMDPLNNHVANLSWRPRWFAIKYAMQFKDPIQYGLDAPVECVNTEEGFNNIRECAMRYGLLENEIIHSIHNGTPVFPSWFTFRMAP